MVSHSDLVICPGKKAYQYWLSIGIPQQKIMIVPFYTSVLHADENNKKLANELDVKYRNKLVVLYLGRLIKKKGVDYLIRAFQQLQQEFSDTVLVITGEGPEKTHLEELCTELGLSNVEFVDAPDETSKPAWFLFSDVYVYPSVTLDLPEEWSLAVMEAMSVGKPVIVTDAVGSAPDLVRAGVNGYVVIEKDSKALYTALKQVIGNEKLRKQMSVMSKKIIDDSFTYEHAVSAFDEAIKSVLCK
jgi:glycosyltransferase involved in cell wall biosynthesis